MHPAAVQAVGNRQGELEDGLLVQGAGIQDHEIAGAAGPIPDQTQHPAIVFGCSARVGHHDWFTDEAPRGGAPHKALAAGQIQLANRLQRIVALLALGHGHPAVASLEAHPVGIDHRKFAAALAKPLPLSCRRFGVDAATLQ